MSEPSTQKDYLRGREAIRLVQAGEPSVELPPEVQKWFTSRTFVAFEVEGWKLDGGSEEDATLQPKDTKVDWDKDAEAKRSSTYQRSV